MRFQFWKTHLKNIVSLQAGFFLMFVMPASTNYQLKDFGFGTGGVGNATSTSYAIDGISGEQSNGKQTDSGADLGSGLLFTNQANVPPVPTFTNPSSYYNKLKIVLATGGNPSDTKFAIAISTDNFTTTNYVQSDATIGATLGAEDYQTYAAWGSGTGTVIIGLAPSTTYKVKVKAWQGKFTETGYGPTATAATINPTLSFDIDVAPTDTDNSVTATGFGNLFAGIVTDSTDKIWVDLDTNGENGGKVYVYSSHAGLQSTAAGYTINTVTGNLTALSEGYGAQGSSATQGSGGPFSVTAAYNLSSNNVAVTDTNIREIFTTSNPVTAGRGSFLLKAKSSAVTPAAGDYSETLTVVASASF